MNKVPRSTAWMAVLLTYASGVLLSLSASAQTLTITNGIQTYGALTNTTVTMTGRCELRVTAPANPIPGCLIHLNSADAWFVLPNIQPSVVAASYLGQIRVNGASAVADGNVRVVQYAMGTVVIPHAAALQPLQVFSGPHFTGTSMLLSQYTAYTGAGLGALAQAISSFKLKRGYMATLAQNPDGTGLSECFVAQEGDLEVGVLPTLDNKVRFVRVFPWRWVSKKGIAGNIASGLNVRWFYNWNIDQNSSRDLEYVPIRQNRSWPGLGQNWQTRGANHLLGYNEPDHTDQANLTVAEAIASWPDLLGTGLRVGAPAVSDGGLSWLYSFMDQADAAGLRVDFVPVHYYRCYGDPANPDGATTQLYNFLKGIYDRVKRPLWVTEWNNGANWTTCSDPSYAQQQATVAKMIEMLDNTPFVERYALYNWVEDVRRVKWDDGSLTGAGVAYRDKLSPLSYVQEVPPGGSRSVAQLPFENNPLDSSGYANHGVAVGSPAFVPGRLGQAVELDGTNTFIQLPPNVAGSAAFSFAAWVYWKGGANWQRLFDFGNDTSHYLFLTPRSGNGTLRFAIKNGGAEQMVETGSLPSNQWCHVAVTLSGNTARLYLNGMPVAASGSFTIVPANFSPAKNYLGESQFAADPLFQGLLDEVQIADYAFSAAQVAALMSNSPPAFNTNWIVGPGGANGVPYSGSIGAEASDPDPGDTLTYSKASGPAWLTIGPDGTLGGTPAEADGGVNEFTVRAIDPAGASAFCVLTITLPITAANGAWISDANGNWTEPARWSGGTIARGAGFTADFSSINISAPRTVTLDLSRSIGTLKFGDTSGNQSWTLASSGGSVLTLDTGTTASPSILVTNTAIVAASLGGTNGFTKSGPGLLVLAATNTLSGTLNVDVDSNSANDGAVRASHPSALANISAIQIRNNNSGSSTLQLDGTAGGLTIPAALAVNCRNSSVATIQNLAGTNRLSGFIALNVGGNALNLQSDAGLLILSGINQYVGSLTGGRSYQFSGAGDHLVSGPIRHATNGAPISLVKSGPGTLTLAGANSYTNTTTVSGGTLLVTGSIASSPVTVGGTATLGGTGTLGGAVTIQPGGTLSPGVAIGTLTFSTGPVLSGTVLMELNRTNAQAADRISVNAGLLTYGGILTVTNVGPELQGGDRFTLFTAAGYTGAFSATNLPAVPAGLKWDFDPAKGVLSVLQTVATSSPGLLTSVTGDTLTLSWPATHTGWRLEAQTNALPAGLGTNWVTVANSTNLNRITLPIDPAGGSVFFRLVYP